MKHAKKIEIVNYTSELKTHFERLNCEWLSYYFEIEPIDVTVLSDPETHILAKGGEILFAKVDDVILGTCALVRGAAITELARMAVTERARGLGIGERLAREAIDRVRLAGEAKLFLVTNTKLTAAIGLYRKLGFKECTNEQHFKYRRANLAMELILDEQTLP